MVCRVPEKLLQRSRSDGLFTTPSKLSGKISETQERKHENVWDEKQRMV
jgi:hypothetical protein